MLDNRYPFGIMLMKNKVSYEGELFSTYVKNPNDKNQIRMPMTTEYLAEMQIINR